MSVTLSAADHRSEEAQLMEQATGLLDEILGPSAGIVQKEWDRNADARERAIYRLRIADPTYPEGKSADFSPDELRSPTHLRVRMHQLWGELLKALSHQQLQALNASGE